VGSNPTPPAIYLRLHGLIGEARLAINQVALNNGGDGTGDRPSTSWKAMTVRVRYSIVAFGHSRRLGESAGLRA